MDADAARLVELLAEPALLVDGNGRVVVANDAVVGLAGVEPTRLRGALLQSLVADAPDAVSDFLRICARSRQLVPGALRWGSAGERERVVAVRCDGAVLVPRTDDVPALVFIRCRPKGESTDRFTLLNRKIEALSKEILERKKLQQERDRLLDVERTAREHAERMSRLKDEFLATLSHELRTPLNAILGWTTVLSNPAASGELPRGLSVIARNARAQSKIIDDLLDVSRIVSGKVRLDVQSVELTSVIEAVLDTVRPAIESKGLRLQTTLDPLAGPINGDPHRLQQVVWNLLSNAVRFTPKGGRVQVLLERVNSHVEITVSDTGEGIAPDFLPFVFDRFSQADASTTRRHGGLGIGLSIVKQLVELHGGSVGAKSPGIGQGATFRVVLPLAVARQSTAESGQYRRHPEGDPITVEDIPAGLLVGLRALIVDDESDAREVLTALLEQQGARAQAVESAAAGLEALRGSRFDVVLCDVGMPDRDGYDFARAVRRLSAEDGGRVPLLAVTAFARAEDRTRALLSGFSAHVSKPVELPELVAVIASLGGRVVPS